MLLLHILENTQKPARRAHISDLFDDFQDHSCDVNTDELDAVAVRNFMPLLQSLWRVDEMKTTNRDEACIHAITETLESANKEQLFISAGHFVLRIGSIMEESYRLTLSDYLHCRSWTQGLNDYEFNASPSVRITLRDVGGDEVNRQLHWRAAVKASFCTIFVVSLADVTRLERGSTTRSKFRAVRSLLWSYLVEKTNPKIILLLNKQDLFRKKLEMVPLHKACKDFKGVAPQGEDEVFEHYCARCENEVVEFFKKMPSSVKTSPTVSKRQAEESEFDMKRVSLHILKAIWHSHVCSPFVSCTTMSHRWPAFFLFPASGKTSCDVRDAGH